MEQLAFTQNLRDCVLKFLFSFSLMFFNDYGKYPKMLRASMDGLNKIAIVTRRIVRPMALSLDIYGKRIYFSDGDIGNVKQLFARM